MGRKALASSREWKEMMNELHHESFVTWWLEARGRKVIVIIIRSGVSDLVDVEVYCDAKPYTLLVVIRSQS